ncbi:hypothetical protein BHE74_00012432 [Ensete ventricosum]|nr:hypothetical protein BHE74_00012432 [Ensete ventricosum]
MVESYDGFVGAMVWGEDMVHHVALMMRGGGVGWRSNRHRHRHRHHHNRGPRQRPLMALQMTWHPRCRRGGPPLGLKNLGNSCYLNSVLQCLTFNKLLGILYVGKSLFANRDKECPFCILERQIARSLSLDGPLEAPSKIHKSLALFAEHFRWGRQEDAHEFLRYVIDACHNACLKIHKRNGGGGTPDGNPKAEGRSGPSTVMKEIFGGALLSQVKCLACKGESNKSDEIMDICLDLFQSSSLKDALARFFHPEVLDGNNKYNCGK